MHDVERSPRYTGEYKIERCTENILNNDRLRTVYQVDELLCEKVRGKYNICFSP